MHAQNVCFKKMDEDTSCLGQHSMHLSGPSSTAGTKRTRRRKQNRVTTVRIGPPALLLQAPIQGHETSQVQEQQVQRLRVCIVHSLDYTTALYRGMRFIHNDRDILLSSLLVSCNLLGKNNNNGGSSILLDAVAPRLATKSDLSLFHTMDYLSHLEYYQCSSLQDQSMLLSTATQQQFGLEDDCSLPETHLGRCDLWNYCQYVAGASITAANHLTQLDDSWDIAINWGGGRHHAFASKASGFCFVNDTVLAIQHLVLSCPSSTKVLYMDVDIHHADAVQEAFYTTSHVLTVSFHRRAPGFFPASEKGSSFSDRGLKAGFGYNVNIPLPEGLSDDDFLDVYKSALTKFTETFQPNYIVLAIGADGLANDPLIVAVDGGWNLTTRGIAACVEATTDVIQSHSSRIKCLLLGGGGYSDVNAARTFLACTAAACCSSRQLPHTISSDDTFILRYSPDFLLHTSSSKSSLTKTNSDKYLEDISKAKEFLESASEFLQSQDKYKTFDEVNKQDIFW
jgi:acetoin utilization deacetylase AcuC-like enzyme